MWHVIVLSIVTLKIYFVYWCYKTWRDYSKHIAQKNSAKLDPETAVLPATEISNNETNGDAIGIESGFATPATKEMGFIEALSPKHLSSFENMSPHIRMICALAPYVQDYLFFTLLYGVAKRHPDPNNVIAKNAFLWSFFLTMFAFSVSLLVFLPGIWYLLFLLSSIPTFWAQAVINEYWDNEERNQSLIVRQAFTGKEIFVTISGALVLGFLISGILLGADK